MLWRFRKVLARPGIKSNIEMELIPVQQHRNGIYEIVRLILILKFEFNILSLNIFPEIGVARAGLGWAGRLGWSLAGTGGACWDLTGPSQPSTGQASRLAKFVRLQLIGNSKLTNYQLT